MGDNAIFVQIGLGILAIFFFVTIGFSVRTWRVAHLVFLSFVFLGATTFIVFAAMTLKTHQQWRTEVHKMDALLETMTKTNYELQYGVLTPKADEAPVPNLRDVKTEIGLALLDRGRVWKNCQPQNFDGMTVKVTTAPAAIEGEAAPKPNNIKVGDLLYAFKEIPDPADQNAPALPKTYLGEFKVTAASETEVTLAPTIPLDAFQLAQIRVVDRNWSLYEVLPIDGHIFFEGLSVDQLKALIPQGDMTNEEYDALITSYDRSSRQDEAKPDDPPEHTWVRVKFIKSHIVEVDSDNPANAELSFFDQNGRAVAQRLRRGESVKFEIGHTALVDQPTADEWVKDGLVTKDKLIYLRPLNDYSKLFEHYFNEREQMADQIAFYTRENAKIDAATKDCAAQVVLLKEETKKLEQDQGNYKLEQTAVTDLEDALKLQADDLKKKLSQTYLLNQQLAAQLAAMQKQLAEEVSKIENTKTAALLK